MAKVDIVTLLNFCDTNNNKYCKMTKIEKNELRKKIL